MPNQDVDVIKQALARRGLAQGAMGTDPTMPMSQTPGMDIAQQEEAPPMPTESPTEVNQLGGGMTKPKSAEQIAVESLGQYLINKSTKAHGQQVFTGA